jgi:hypothetical protein
MDYRARCDELFQTFEALYALEQPLIPRSDPVRLLSTVIRTSAVMLSLPHDLAHPDRHIGLRFNPDLDGENFDQLLLAIYRTFLTSVHIWCEQGVIEFCNQRGISVQCSLTRKWDAAVRSIALTPEDQTKLRKLRPPDNLSSADIVNAATNHLPSARRAYWRRFFEAMGVVRNKCSHAHIDPELKFSEMERLEKAGLGGFLQGKRLHFSAPMMPLVIETLVLFFNEVEVAPLFPPQPTTSPSTSG